MKLLVNAGVCLLLLGAVAFGASIDGKWVMERKMEREGKSFSITQTFDLKASGNKLTGTVSLSFGNQEPRAIPIRNGKLDGDKFSFTVVMETPKGEFKSVYEGTVEGDTIRGTVSREGGQGRPFEAKRK
jgi:hypothetical protein